MVWVRDEPNPTATGAVLAPVPNPSAADALSSVAASSAAPGKRGSELRSMRLCNASFLGRPSHQTHHIDDIVGFFFFFFFPCSGCIMCVCLVGSSLARTEMAWRHRILNFLFSIFRYCCWHFDRSSVRPAAAAGGGRHQAGAQDLNFAWQEANHVATQVHDRGLDDP